jgi:hypothetical protein
MGQRNKDVCGCATKIRLRRCAKNALSEPLCDFFTPVGKYETLYLLVERTTKLLLLVLNEQYVRQPLVVVDFQKEQSSVRTESQEINGI